MSDNIQFVDFEKYCETCKYVKKKEVEDPCNECLEVGAREGSGKPERWEEKE
ncbi:MAG: hypothetical protein HFG80_05960 [Eubacterium sp.]|nr:hypothetical protein [Eubacterium sp.]